jgi:hypothetical protein
MDAGSLTIHSIPRITRFLIVVTATPDEPRISRDARSTNCFDTILGDGKTPVSRTEMIRTAHEIRRRCDETPDSLAWVWIAHDQFFYHSVWQVFMTFGPPGWIPPHLQASIDSDKTLARLRRERDEAKRRESERLKVLNCGKKKEKRIVDTIAGS